MEPETALSESARSRIEEALAANQTYDGDLPDWLDGWSAEGTVETGIPGARRSNSALRLERDDDEHDEG
jgi:hypothetical protein